MDYNVLNFNSDILAEPLPVKPVFNPQPQDATGPDATQIPEQPITTQIPEQPEAPNGEELPTLGFFNLNKQTVGRVPRKIRKEFFAMYEDADKELQTIFNGVKTEVDNKYKERLDFELKAVGSPYATNEQILNTPAGRQVNEKVQNDYQEELNTLFQQKSSNIYSGLVKKQKDLFSTVPSAKRATKVQARVTAALTDPGQNLGFSYFFDNDENYNNYSSIIQEFVKKGDISSPGYLDAVRKRDQYLEYWSNSAKPEYIERPIDQQVWLNGVLHDKGAPTPQYAVRIDNLKEGQNVRVPDGGVYLYWQDDNGDAHYDFVNSTGNKFYTDQPLSQVAQDRLAPGEDKRGWDITQGIPDQRIPYLTVGKQGKYLANQFEISRLETPATKGLALYGVGDNTFSYSKQTQEIDPKTGKGVIDPETNMPKMLPSDEITITGVYRSPEQIQTDLDEVNSQLKDNPNDQDLLRRKGALERNYQKSVKVQADRYKFAENMTQALGEKLYGEKDWKKIKDKVRFEDALIEGFNLYSRQGIFPALISGKKSGKHNLTDLGYEFIDFLSKDQNWESINTFSAENLQKSLYDFTQSRVKKVEDELNQTKIDGIPFTAFASTANSVYENVNQQINKFNATQTKLSSIISANYNGAKSGDQEALRIYNSAIKTYNNNISVFNKNVVNNPNNTYYLQKMETPEFADNMAKLDEIDFLKRENYEMLKKQQLVTEGKATQPEGIKMQPTGNIFLDGSATFLTSFINNGLSFLNSVAGVTSQGYSYILGSVGLGGGARGSDYFAASAQTIGNEIDRYTRVEALPESGPDGKFSFRNNILNLMSMSGSAGFDLLSTLAAPEVRLMKGASAAAKYINRFPGLFGVFTTGHFYDEWENAERAGMKGSSKILTHIVAKNLIQTGLENLVNVKDVFPEGAVTSKALRSKFNGELNKVLSETAGNVSFADYGTAVYNTLKDLAPRVANFALKEFALEENGQLFAEELQNKATNIIGNYNFDEDVFNMRSAIDNVAVGLILGPITLLGGSVRAVSNRRAETVYALVDEYGYDKVYNSLLDLRNAKLNKVQGSEKIDEKFVNSMLKELPISLSIKKPEGISDVKWLSIKASLVKKEALTKQMKSSPESMRPIFQSQIDQLDAGISTTMSTSDEALTEAFRNDAVEILKDENGVPYFSKIKQIQDATEESKGPQQEGRTESNIPEYARAQQGEQVQAPQPTAAPGYSDISSQGQVAPGKRLFNEPNPDAAVIENEFKVSKGIETPEPARITSLDESKSKRIADAYEQLVDNPNDPEVRAAYQAMATETMDQFDAIAKSGVKVEIWTGEGEPYKNSAEMISDVRDNKHMYIFSTESGFGENKITDEQRQQNAMLRDSGVKDVNGKPLLINDIFRFVHDYFGHTRLGNSFGAIGEENAWNVHARMYSPLARRAMTTETRGQNSWVNFNKSLRNPDGSMKKKGDDGYIPPASRPFAPQKMGLLPEEFSNIEEAYSVQNNVQPEAMVPTVAPTAAPTEVTPARQLTEQESTRMSDARTMTPAEFSAKYPDVSPESIDMIKKSGFDNEQDFDNWQAEQVSKANQVASQIRDSLFTGKADMNILSHALYSSWSKIVPGLNMVWDNYASNVEKAGYPEAYKDYAGFYDPATKTVYINPDKMGLDTPIHEFGHVWYAVANIVDKNLTKRGRDLIRGTEYEARVRAMDAYKDLEPEEIEEEALVLAIGERGAGIIDQVRRNNFLTWLSDLFNLVAKKFGVEINVENLTLGEFLDFAAMDILSGGQVLLNTSTEVEVEASGVKPSIVSAERYAAYVPQVKPRLDKAKQMQAEGEDSSVIWEETGMENVDGKWMSELNYDAKITIDMPASIESMDAKGESSIVLPIAKVFSYPEFFKVYPDARKINVKISRFNSDYIAAYDDRNNIIRLNIDPEKYDYVGGDYTSAVLHELQHYAQEMDKTPGGANLFFEFDSAKSRMANTFEKAGFTDDANTVKSIEYGKEYTGNNLEFYKKVLSAAEFSYLTSKGEIQARNVEKRFVNPQKRQHAPTVTHDRVKASVKSTLESSPYSKFMTEDKDSYYFFHWSNEERKVIDPKKFGNNRITSREERIARPSAAFFYTRPDFREMGVGDYGHVVKVPKDKVYPATADPLNFFDEAKSLFEKSHPGMAFGPNQQIGWITKVANAKGYDMVVAKWGKQLRAETTNKVKPEWYSRPSGWATETNPKYAKLKKGVNKLQVKPSISSRYGLDDKWSDRAINEARTMLNNGMFQITENTATGPVGFTLSVNGNVHGVYASMQEAEDQRDNIIKATIMKGYPQVSEMVAQNILFNAKRKDFTKPLNPSIVQGILPSVSSRGYVGDTRTMPQKIKDATKRFFRKYFTFSKGLPKEITLLKESMGGKLSYQVSLAESMVKDLNKVAKKIGFEDWATYDQALRDYRTYNPTNPFWIGGQPQYSPAANTNPAFFNLPAEIRRYVVSMRALLDGMSEQLVRSGLVSPDMALTLESNMGKYVHRSYALFTMGDEWSKKVKNNKKVIDAAHENLFQLYYAHLTATNPNMSQQEIINQANEEADKEINRILDSKKPFFGRDEASFLPYRNTGSLRQRQEQPQWLRDLLGEYTDPGTAFLLSVGETATLLQTSDYLAKLRDFGLGTVFFEEGNRPADATYRIGSMGQMLKPLEGLYTTKEMYDLLIETDNNRSSNLKWAWRLMNLNKMMKTVFSPVTQFKNFLSNTGFAMHNGYFDVTAISDAWGYFRRQVVNNKSQDVIASLRPLFERGVLNQSLTAKELANIFRTNDFEQYVLDNADKPGIQDYLSDPGKLWRATNRAASRLYQASDDFWKIYAYYNEQRSLSKILYNKEYESLTQSEKDDVDNQSADRVMNVMPTYDRVLEIFKTVSKTGVLGNFTAFRAEVFRVLANSYSYAYNDIVNGIKDKNPRMVAYGTKRLLGIASYNALRMEGIYLLSKWAGLGVSGLASSLWGGGDDEDKEKLAINSFVADWARSDDKVYDNSKVKDGVIEYYTFSSVDPYATIYNIFNAYKYGNEYDEKGGLIASSLEVVAPFIEPEMTLRAFSSAITNKDAYGFSIYNEDDTYLRKIFDGSFYVAKETLTPGAATWLNRMFYRRDDEGKLQFGFNPSELYTAPVGARPYVININRKWSSELFNASKNVFGDIPMDFNRAAKNNESYEDRANERYNKEILRLHNIYTDAIRLGYPEDKLLETLKSSRIDRRTKMAILTGETFKVFDKEGKIGRRNPED